MSEKPEPQGDWSEASSEVLTIARGLIHRHFPYLKDARICFLFRKEAQKNKGKTVIGHCEKVSSKLQTVFEYDFLIWLSEEHYQRMSGAQREALIDHELLHCWIGEAGYTTRDHDVELFFDEIERHGLWSTDLRQTDAAIDSWWQQALPGTEYIRTRHGTVDTVSGEIMDRIGND
jgi:predicted metallopeptidase